MPYITSAERIEQGIHQGIQQGIHLGEAAVLSRLLQHKFEALPESYQVKLEEADAETLPEWSERVLTAETLDDVFNINGDR